MKIYVMRHGTTVWNETGITQGRSQNRLSKSGKAMVEQQAKQYKNVQFDAIICSPLMRTVQTANIINKYHNAKIIKDDSITEIDQGIFTGTRFSKLSQQEKELKLARSKKAQMESFEECFDRVKSFVDNIKNKYNFENIFIVTHNCVATFIEFVLNNTKIDFTNYKFVSGFENAQIKCFEV